MGEIIHVTQVDVVESHRLRLRFEDGIEGELDFKGESWEGVFAPLADPDFFAKVIVDEELGTVVWPNGADIAPETLRASVIEGSPTLLDVAAGDPSPSKVLPSYFIIDFTIVDHGVLSLTFADGLTGEVDMLDRLWGPIFARVRTPEGFAEAFLDHGVIAWPGEVDFAPDTLYERVRTGVWPEALPA
jgi:Protein of unknown function (DUF2442)